MSNLLSLIIYVFKVYPKVNELSRPRLIKLIYLIDWKYTIENGKQFTNLKWYYTNNGPYVNDIMDVIKSRTDLFSVESKINRFGSISDKISLNDKNLNVDLPAIVQDSADFIIKNTARLQWSNFVTLVYSTFPILANSKDTELDLVKDFERFKIYRLHQKNS